MLYPISEQIAALLESVYDPETGELLDGTTEEDLQAAIQNLQMDFDEIEIGRASCRERV